MNGVSKVMLLALQPHPAAPPGKISSIHVELIPAADDYLITYVVSGAEHLVVPSWSSPRRANGLWKTTCFELFVQFDPSDGYYEFNFSPSGEWAAYKFSGFRKGMADHPVSVPPHIEDSRHSEIELPRVLPQEKAVVRFALEVDLDLSDLPPGWPRIGLSAIIEEVDGTKSYWALAHGPGEPDFHQPACFALELPPAG